MYAFSNLKGEAQSFVTRATSSGQSRRPAAAIALARIVAAQFTIPSAPVQNVEQEYRMACQIKAEKDISEINEILPIDLNLALEMCRAYYIFRYRNAHPSESVFSFRPDRYIEDFFDISRSFSDSILETIRASGNDLSFFALGFNKVLRDLKEAADKNPAGLV